MSRPRFLADNDLNDAIVLGVLRREPAIEFKRLRDLRLAALPDDAVLDYAARENWIVVSHDVNTMTDVAFNRLSSQMTMNGLFLVHQRTPLGPVIEDLVLIWADSEAEEWTQQVRFLPL
jgi:hypothetical protein